jgi:hypothetical protein
MMRHVEEKSEGVGRLRAPETLPRSDLITYGNCRRADINIQIHASLLLATWQLGVITFTW